VIAQEKFQPSRQLVDAFVRSERVTFQNAAFAKDTAAAWDALKAIHIVSQPFAGPHWASHVAMLRFAVSLREWREVGGQLLRLALVPLGNATGHLPAGNHGRTRASPFKPMPVDDELFQRLRAISSNITNQKTGH
jgi:hypothetical protein